MSNDFIPFAVGGSANVTPQATYAANTTLTQNGFVAGIAKSPDLNKVWRQSSIMAAVLAQFITNTTGQNAVDDGTTATLLANLISAVSAQSESIVGGVRNLSMTVSAASATATVTADEIIVGSALGGLKYTLPNFSKTINLATTGAGGMDTGTAPVSSFVGIYAIWNPTTSTSALLGVSANAVTLPNVYGGANMPAGFTASALLTVLPTNASSQIVPCVVMDRVAALSGLAGFTTNTVAATPTIVNNLGVPLNAKKCSGFLQLGSTAASAMSMSISASSAGVGAKTLAQNVAVGSSVAVPFENLLLSVSQRMFYTAASTAGTATFLINVFQYEI
jgi:hypothetical protein